jgi:hypothetical protein
LLDAAASASAPNGPPSEDNEFAIQRNSRLLLTIHRSFLSLF